MALFRLLYRSDSELTGSDRVVGELAFAIAAHAADRNVADGITGALMFAGSVFVQVLEGECAAIETTFERICRDLRHRSVVLLDFSSIEHRVFDDCAMVAFEGDQLARSLFPALSEATSFAHRNPLSANAVVDRMRTLLDRRIARSRDQRLDRMIATDVAA